MGYSYAVVDGKEVGYGVDAICEHDGCDTEIDRGMDYACGGWPGEGQTFCAGFFCHDHLGFTNITADPDAHDGQRCHGCRDDFEASVYEARLVLELAEFRVFRPEDCQGAIARGGGSHVLTICDRKDAEYWLVPKEDV